MRTYWPAWMIELGGLEVTVYRSENLRRGRGENYALA